MGRLVLSSLIFLAPSLAAGADLAEIRHLLARTGFGATPAEIEALLPLSYEDAVDALLAGTHVEPVTPLPADLASWTPRRRGEDLSEEERRAGRVARREQAHALKAWWYEEMLATDSPMTERMTLFWHGHFTSSLRECKVPALLLRQNLLLRRHALGRFSDLTHAIARDPAMLAYLDGASSRAGAPNENFARELMELFTLGEGHFTERDVQEAARAFTGWGIDPLDGSFLFRPGRHDYGTKSVLGRTGRLDGDDVIDALLEHPRAAEHVTEQLWDELVGGERDRAEIRRLAGVYRRSGLDTEALLRALLLSPAFRDPARRGALIKSPVDLIVGTIRSLRLPITDGRRLALAGRRLGQDLFDPPDVRGWRGGAHWITGPTLLARRRVLETALGALEGSAGLTGPARADGSPWRRPHAGEPLVTERWARADQLVAWLLATPPVEPVPEASDPLAVLRHVVLDPAYQLE